MEQHFETNYGEIKQTTTFNQDELKVVEILLDRSDEDCLISHYSDLDNRILLTLKETNVIKQSYDGLYIELSIALWLVRK